MLRSNTRHGFFLNSALHAPHTEDARGLAEFQEFKQTPTLGRNSISHPSVGVFPFISTDKFQIFDQRINGVVRDFLCPQESVAGNAPP